MLKTMNTVTKLYNVFWYDLMRGSEIQLKSSDSEEADTEKLQPLHQGANNIYLISIFTFTLNVYFLFLYEQFYTKTRLMFGQNLRTN